MMLFSKPKWTKPKHRAEKRKTNWRFEYRMVKNRWRFFFKARLKTIIEDWKDTKWRN